MNELTNNKGTYLFDSEKFDAIKSRMENKMNDKLKEIREKHFKPEYISSKYYLDKLNPLQSETYQLGRQEVIDEIEKAISEHLSRHLQFRGRYANGTKFIDVKIILSKLNNLKK